MKSSLQIWCGPDSSRDCIPDTWLCDGENDCGNYSDETDCLSIDCGPAMIKCAVDDVCIPGAWECDGVADCSDMQDEVFCDQVCMNASAQSLEVIKDIF